VLGLIAGAGFPGFAGLAELCLAAASVALIAVSGAG
jgi:hypothetical protein